MIFDFILNPLISILVNISDFWGRLPHSAIQTTHPSVFQIILYYSVLGCIISIFYKEIREKYLKKIIITLAILFAIWMITLILCGNNVSCKQSGNDLIDCGICHNGNRVYTENDKVCSYSTCVNGELSGNERSMRL